MNLWSRWVLGGAALLTAPALWQAFVTGSMAVDTAVTRWAISALLVWVALSLLVMAVGKPANRLPRPVSDTDA